MGMTLPADLERILNDLGFTWPEVDETELAAAGSAWASLTGHLHSAASAAQNTIDQLTATNQGPAMDAFLTQWSGQDAPAAVLSDTATGVAAGGAALLVCAAITLALKINTIVNLVILAIEIAQAIATAVPTFGASLAEIPAFKMITQRIIGALINEATAAIMD
jgi:hypothetical protein